MNYNFFRTCNLVFAQNACISIVFVIKYFYDLEEQDKSCYYYWNIILPKADVCDKTPKQ